MMDDSVEETAAPAIDVHVDGGVDSDVSADKSGQNAPPGNEPAPPASPSEDPETRITSLEDQVLRGKADYQNLLRRTAMEQAQALRYANAELIRGLLSVVDDLERSLAAVEQSDDFGLLRDGVRLAYKNFMKALHDQGLEPIDSMLKPFDPAVHNAMMQRASSDDPPGTVIEVLTKGYRLRDRVLRPAMVIVSKDADTSDTPTPTDDSTDEKSE